MDLIDRQALLRKLFPYEVVDKKNCAINAYAVEKAILDMPQKNQLCNRCMRKTICYNDPLCLTHCDFYKKDDEK
jgi:hypothetical protein